MIQRLCRDWTDLDGELHAAGDYVEIDDDLLPQMRDDGFVADEFAADELRANGFVAAGSPAVGRPTVPPGSGHVGCVGPSGPRTRDSSPPPGGYPSYSQDDIVIIDGDSDEPGDAASPGRR